VQDIDLRRVKLAIVRPALNYIARQYRANPARRVLIRVGAWRMHGVAWHGMAWPGCVVRHGHSWSCCMCAEGRRWPDGQTSLSEVGDEVLRVLAGIGLTSRVKVRVGCIEIRAIRPGPTRSGRRDSGF
jgi:hypothetical protein